MLVVPLSPVPAQTVRVSLAGQDCRVTVRQKAYGMFLDLAVGGAPVLFGVLCLDRVKLVRSAYLGFVGDLAFEDTQGRDDPAYATLGTRHRLVYLETADLAATPAT